MSNILLITSRNIYENSGESSLINRRSKAIYRKKNKKIDTIGITRDKVNRKKEYLEQFNCYNENLIFKYNKFNFLYKIFLFRKNLKKYLLEKRPKNIFISGFTLIFFYIDILIDYKKIEKVKYFYDMHGCTEEFEEYLIKNKYLGKCINKFYSKIEKKSLTICDSIFIVSNSMKEYIERKYLIFNKEYYFIPCGIDEIFIDRAYLRKKWRKKFGILDNEKVFLYSGGTSKWQQIDESIKLYENEFKKLNYKMVIFSKNIEEINNILKKMNLNRKDYIIKSLKLNELTDALTIGDIGVMLREKSMTNLVAFPNKFSEYIKSGLLVLASENVEEQRKIILEYGIGEIKEKNSIEKIEVKVEERLSNLGEFYKKCDQLIKDKLSYEKNVDYIKLLD
ncbi:glycosyltransferase [Fusobacterium varium]|uniref:glycosyltransferase n=1 Tax=Fusobacterium varium TaxID=856 RepID=UPI000E504044|nr:glycosyltransferase [Fusobacterium varium]RHG36868.1 glycosyltransferase [Fusobacterium varium]